MKKTILITGASTGIGRATVKKFLSENWNVIATMRTPEKETELQSSDNLLITKLDVTDAGSIREAIRLWTEQFWKIDVVLNNAGYWLTWPFEAASPEQIRKQFDTNVFWAMSVTREILPHMRENTSGIIINITSIWGLMTFPLYSLYHGTKWALEWWGESLNYELDQFGIRIKSVEPGPIKTDFYDRSPDIAKKEWLTAYDALVKKIFAGMQKSGETGATPETVAKTIFRAATDWSKRLRYPADPQAKMILFLRKILPDCLYFKIVKAITKA